MKLQSVRLEDVPKWILDLKDWHHEVLKDFAAQGAPGWHTFLIVEEDEPIGCLIYVESPLYSSIHIDTIILKPEGSTTKRLGEALRLGRRMGMTIASVLGFKHITCGTRAPETYERLLAEDDYRGYVLEVVLREETALEN